MGTHRATLLLRRLVDGEPGAANELFPLVYRELRALAGSYVGGPGRGRDPTLPATALVHEAYLKLVEPSETAWKDRAHFFALAATAMRQILSDRARRRRAQKRGGDLERVTLENLATPPQHSIVDVVALDDALEKLAQLDERQARIVELRFFAGLENEEVAQVLGLSSRTVEREWRGIRAWLSRELSGEA